MKKLTLILLCFYLFSCGSESNNDTQESSGQQTTQPDINLASEANGASVTASYDQDSAQFVIDGDSTTSLYWSANVTDDFFTIDLGRTASVSAITVYTNDTSYSSQNPSKIVEVSNDGVTWLETVNAFGGDLRCSSSSTGSGRIYCKLSENYSMRYLRLTITATTDPGLIQIHEVEIMGQ
ncbi:MAG: discoidin domain-containing protein [Reinekea sp.]